MFSSHLGHKPGCGSCVRDRGSCRFDRRAVLNDLTSLRYVSRLDRTLTVADGKVTVELTPTETDTLAGDRADIEASSETTDSAVEVTGRNSIKEANNR